MQETLRLREELTAAQAAAQSASAVCVWHMQQPALQQSTQIACLPCTHVH